MLEVGYDWGVNARVFWIEDRIKASAFASVADSPHLNPLLRTPVRSSWRLVRLGSPQGERKGRAYFARTPPTSFFELRKTQRRPSRGAYICFCETNPIFTGDKTAANQQHYRVLYNKISGKQFGFVFQNEPNCHGKTASGVSSDSALGGVLGSSSTKNGVVCKKMKSPEGRLLWSFERFLRSCDSGALSVMSGESVAAIHRFLTQLQGPYHD